jgi:hypothetical protein
MNRRAPTGNFRDMEWAEYDIYLSQGYCTASLHKRVMLLGANLRRVVQIPKRERSAAR